MTLNLSHMNKAPQPVEDLLLATDWASTPVGPVDQWPQSLGATIKLLVQSRYPMVLLWTDDLIQIYNDAYIALIGDKHPRAFGRSIRETQAESWDVIGPMIREVMSTRVSNWVPSQQLVLNRAGFTEEAYFSLSYSAVEDDAGAVRGMLCVCSEITQQVLSERRLRLQRELVFRDARTVVDAAVNMIEVFSRHRWDIPFAAIFLADQSDPKKLTLAASQGFGAANIEAYAEVDLESTSVSETFRRGMQGETVVRDNIEFLGITGGPFDSPVSRGVMLPIFGAPGQPPIGVIGLGANPNVAFDNSHHTFFELLGAQISAIMQTAEAYEEERRRAEQLAELDRAKTAFFSNVSHEFRTPLTLLLGPLEEVLSSDTLSSAERGSLKVAQRNGLRLLRLVNTLLDFSRIEAGRADAQFRKTNLGQLTRDLASSFESACIKAGIDLRIDCPPTTVPVYVDIDMWEKIVLNLVSNAFKFTAEGTIAVSVAEAPDQVILRVEDTGIGIPDEELPRIFERFHRVADARGRSYEGTGIGLALVKELVEMHGATIEVKSALGVGTTFCVSLPTGSRHLPAAKVIEESAPLAVQSQARAFVEEALQWLPQAALLEPAGELAIPTIGTPVEKPSILLADDNADMRSYIERLLRDRFDIHSVADGQAALDHIAAHRYDLALLDVMMPKLDGFSVLRLIRAAEDLKALPVILLSARAGEEARIEGIAAGADDYLVKPFGARELLARAEGAVRLARERRLASQRDLEARLATEVARAELSRKDDMIAEINHRVKNNLQLLSSLISIAVREVADPQAKERLISLKDRVVNLGLVHGLLYQTGEDEVEADIFLRNLAERLVLAYEQSKAEVVFEAQPVRLPAPAAVTLGLLLNEAVLNALKHAFPPERTDAKITIVLAPTPDMITLSVSDNGIGYQGPRTASSGSRLMATFARQLGGSMETYVDSGTTVTVEFPRANEEDRFNHRR